MAGSQKVNRIWEQSVPLDIYLQPAKKDKIWWEQHVDLLTLLFREVEPKPGMSSGMTAGELEQF